MTRMISFAEVQERTTLSRSTIERGEKSGEFPKRIRLSENRIAWREEDIDNWIETKLKARSDEPGEPQ